MNVTFGIDYVALSALGNVYNGEPGPLAQAIASRAVGALLFVTTIVITNQDYHDTPSWTGTARRSLSAFLL